jgi:hypothetical protein
MLIHCLPGQLADAKIVYTAAPMKLEQNTPSIQLDLNHDGIPDCFFDNHFDVVSFLNVTEAFRQSYLCVQCAEPMPSEAETKTTKAE